MLASELEAGHVIAMPGWMLHEDLAGLHFQIKAKAVERLGDLVVVSHSDNVQTWFPADEEVRVL